MPENNTVLIIALVVVFLVVVYIGFAYYIYRRILFDYNKPPKNLVDHEEDFYKESYEWFQKIPKEEISVKSYDGLKLMGYFIPSFNKDSENMAIVLHGYQSKGTDMIIIAKMYSDLGFKVILPDLRGHGKSEGKFTTMGHYEKYDLKKWVNFALNTYGSTDKILIHGVSMGASMAIMLTEMDVPKNVKFLVLDSGFTHVKGTFIHTFRQKFLTIFLPGFSMITYLRHRFFLEQIKPIRAMRKNKIPFLIIHGEQDQFAPLKMAEELYAASPAEQKELLVIEGSKHALGYRVDRDKCVERITENIKDIFGIKASYIKKLK